MTTPTEKGNSWLKQQYAIGVFVFEKHVANNPITITDSVRYMFLRLGLA